MTTNPACPPIPTRDELLHSGNFIEVNINNLVPNETVVLSLMNGMAIQCMEIVALNNPVGTIRYRLNGQNNEWQQQINEFTPPHARFFRKKNHRKEFDDMTKKMEVRIRNYPENQQLTSAETIFANKGLSDKIGNFLGPPISGKGGRRKTKRTRRTRKNKRKSTRRIRRKYKR
jgi:hypothetical protein